MAWIPIPGSDQPPPPPGAKLYVPPEAGLPIAVDVMVRPGPDAPLPDAADGDSFLPPPEYLAYERFRALFAASPEDIALVTGYAAQFRLEIDQKRTSAEERRVALTGNTGDFSEAFNVRLDTYLIGDRPFRIQVGPVQLPEELSQVVEIVFGLDDRPTDLSVPSGLRAGEVPTPIKDLIDQYAFPTQKPGTTVALDGTGQTIGIIRTGGAYVQADIDAHFTRLGLTSPNITVVGVPLDLGPAATLETPLDIEIVGTVVPKAKIVVYYAAADTYSSLIQTTLSALTDSINQPSVLSISWGGAEAKWAVADQTYLDAQVQLAAQNLGVSVCAASGDYGSGGIGTLSHPDKWDHAVFPASSPHVLACGGTTLTGAKTATSAEVVWCPNNGEHASGGGVSDTFARPSWQQNVGVPASKNPGGRVGRGVPDVAAHAGEYDVVIGGLEVGVGGTSASAPLWAGLLARINQARGKRLGFVHPYLYNQYVLGPGKQSFRDITVGNNSCPVTIGLAVAPTTPQPYSAKTGWDACTGLGSPRGANLTPLLMNAP